jgi:hypothetical protein
MNGISVNRNTPGVIERGTSRVRVIAELTLRLPLGVNDQWGAEKHQGNEK